MVIDSSAIIAILLEEADRETYAAALAQPGRRLLSAVTLFETALVAEGRKSAAGKAWLDLLIADSKIDVIPFDSEHAKAAREAWRSFGKGRHPASLNFGDCCAYAVAKVTGEPLLFKGSDFAKTDIESYL